jgi:hypothetical protein
MDAVYFKRIATSWSSERLNGNRVEPNRKTFVQINYAAVKQLRRQSSAEERVGQPPVSRGTCSK